MRTMRILWRIAVGMVHSVQNSVGSRREVGTTLPHPCEKVEEFFPILIHVEHLMCSVPVQEEALAEQGEIPMQQEEKDDYHSA
ncbi:hypothetical protein C8N25_10178 [Algoriphagus antarcticus]|uniref:Uncharacterized protein n=1 Tax=Algoriphagus antarcticus TaxID=238540 RepID=A0A3E0E933_9BACT|nr:hypothetical protein C8N25_10178 [Algoriphagus antarcticus]